MRKLLILFSITGYVATAQPVINTHDIYTGTYDGNPTNLYVFNNALYFFATEGTYGIELWKLDAVTAPQRQLNIGPGAGDGHTPWKFYQIVGSNGSIYMTAKDGNHGLELWRYNGTTNPKMVRDIYLGAGGSLPSYMTPLGENIYFSAKDSIDWQLWRYNAIKDSAEKVGGYATGHNPGFVYYITEYKGKLYFHGRTDSFGRELYYYDPTINHIGLVADIDTTNTTSGAAFGPRNLIVIDNYLYFTTRTVQHGRELYRYDGTNPPTRLTDINTNGDGISNSDKNIVKYNGQIYLSGASSGTDYQLHKYNPTTNQTSLVQKINTTGAAHPYELTVYNNRLYFIATDGVHGYEVWQYDTVNNAKMVVDAYPGSAHSYPRELTVFNNKLYFSAENPVIGRELYSVFDTSSIIPPNSINITNSNFAFIVYPNPVNNVAHIQFNLKQSQTLNITLTDMNGRIVYQTGNVLYSASKHTVDVPTQQLAIGNYMYSISSNNVLISSGKLSKL